MTYKLITPLAAIVGLVFAFTPLTVMALDPAPKCEADKLKTAAKYAACRLGADSKAVKKDTVPDYSKCTAKFSDKWQKSEGKAGPGVCPSEDNEDAVGTRIGDLADIIATMISGICPVDGGDLACSAVNTNECFVCVQNKPSENICFNAWIGGCVTEADNILCAEAVNADGCADACCF
jgi:hypothetical protein